TLALERDALGAGSIAHILETRRRRRGQKPPLPLALPDRPGLRELDVHPHRLETYDVLTRRPDPDEPGD
ncbi:MAG: IS21 family transposase, partial [Actinobacteria bacterium]|nr:IS21 family transposase [Actinomycetota bacterium]NIW30249.1 IS21 family transposase [Actinomycetota bacterium]